MAEMTFHEIERPSEDGLLRRTGASTWQPLISAVVATMANGKAIELSAPETVPKLKAFKTGLYSRMKGRNVTTRCYLSNDRARLVIWAEPRRGEQKARAK